MPHGTVKNKKDEKKWSHAQEIVKKQYSLNEKSGPQFWKLVMGVYKNMKKPKTKKAFDRSTILRIMFKG